MWQRLDVPGMEIAKLRVTSRAHLPVRLSGHAMVVLSDRPVAYQYSVYADAAWQTARCIVTPDAPGSRAISLAVENGRWVADKRGGWIQFDLAPLAGCVDVDLGISPSTNTLPIRRLNLAVGESRELTAAWVRFPELTVEPLAQRYTRLDERRYRYESIVSGFTAELEIDDLGLVVSYEGIWRRVAAGTGA
jgi:hypothetical protein